MWRWAKRPTSLRWRLVRSYEFRPFRRPTESQAARQPPPDSTRARSRRSPPAPRALRPAQGVVRVRVVGSACLFLPNCGSVRPSEVVYHSRPCRSKIAPLGLRNAQRSGAASSTYVAELALFIRVCMNSVESGWFWGAGGAAAGAGGADRRGWLEGGHFWGGAAATFALIASQNKCVSGAK